MDVKIKLYSLWGEHGSSDTFFFAYLYLFFRRRRIVRKIFFCFKENACDTKDAMCARVVTATNFF